jgi:hypothetical protein
LTAGISKIQAYITSIESKRGTSTSKKSVPRLTVEVQKGVDIQHSGQCVTPGAFVKGQIDGHPNQEFQTTVGEPQIPKWYGLFQFTDVNTAKPGVALNLCVYLMYRSHD